MIVSIIALASCYSSEPADEWRNLFNGSDISNWIVKINHHPVGDNYGETFRVEEGMIKVRYDHYKKFDGQFGHLYYKSPFSKFHLSLEYQFIGQVRDDAPANTALNSGVMFHAQDPRTMNVDQGWPICVEMQFLAELEDGQPRPTGNMCSPGTEILFNGKRYESHCLDSSSPSYKPGTWVKADLIVLGDSLITHLINGDTVLQYSKPTIGGGSVEEYNTSEWQPGKALKSGFIALQSEGQPINFRNIKIRLLE
ncbi:DUF1080 domain-containing protein [Chryseolinea soli]|uniref:DUF1080 domain-containing protein n=1 Tax=Chryseolinea soli TaxID=2321403 RepID=A0A385SWI7_9BACT|nr:DUF1080 domain-containing protein [Chryseolinea soli]